MKNKMQIGVSLLSLIALLTYTLVHTGSLLSRYVHPAVIGYIAAFGIEAAVVSLSLRIGQLRGRQESSGFFIFVLFSVVFVSAIANIAEGFTAVQSEPLTIESLRQLDPIQAFIGVAATGLVSLIVLALAEIIGTDVETAVNNTNPVREQKSDLPQNTDAQIIHNSSQKVSPFLSSTGDPGNVAHARAVKARLDATNKLEAMNGLLVYVQDNPNASLADIGQVINRSKTTVSNYLRELQKDGRLQKNGNGWQITQHE